VKIIKGRGEKKLSYANTKEAVELKNRYTLKFCASKNAFCLITLAYHMKGGAGRLDGVYWKNRSTKGPT